MFELATQLITLYQALQLVGLAPSVFLIVFLGVMCLRNYQAFIPLLYFIALTSSFLIPLMSLRYTDDEMLWLRGALLLGQSTLVACCFMLIMQFILGKVPSLGYWSVLFVPMLGGSLIIYASIMTSPEICDIAKGCLNAQSLTIFYNLFSSSLVFLLLGYYAVRHQFNRLDSEHKRHKYYLAAVLVLLHLALLGLDLAVLAGYTQILPAQFAGTIIKLSFIYLILTSLFRVYYPMMMEQAFAPLAVSNNKYNEEQDKQLVARIEQLLQEAHIYREMRLNRAALASKLEVSENTLSRVMNSYLGKSFNELINYYRIEDAKRRLQSEDTAITTIGSEVGFNSTASFNRVFKESVGMSPTEWRTQSLAL